MTGANGGADNNISVAFDSQSGGAAAAGSGSAQQMQADHMQTIDGKKPSEIPPIQSGAGEFYPVAGSTTKSGAGDVPGGRPQGGPARQQAGGASM